MSRKNQDKGRLPQFIPMFKHTINSKAYITLSTGARCALFELTSMYSTNSQNAVFLSARDGAKRLGACKDTVCKWLRELEHYGFIAMVRGAHLGVEGLGKATLYRLTDRAFAGKPATREFDAWDGVLFDPEKQNPVRKTRTPRQKSSDIRNGARMSQKRNKRPNPSDIRAHIGCPTSSDISRYTTPFAASWYSENWTSKVIEGEAPHPDDIANGEADSPLWVDAWLEQIPVPTLSLSEIREAMGYRQ
jgi:hypothetical protein